MNTNDTQRIQHLERLVDDATQAMALLRKENERQATQISSLLAGMEQPEREDVGG